jgi:glycosyltransferase involved in cell wall biosynthesis
LATSGDFLMAMDRSLPHDWRHTRLHDERHQEAGCWQRHPGRHDSLGLLFCCSPATWEAADIVRASDIALFPSYGEALPIALIEASAGARPVVAADAGGVREVVSEGVSRTLIPSGPYPRHSRGRDRPAARSGTPDSNGPGGRTIVEERFNMYNWAHRLADIYAETTAGRTLGSFDPYRP